ncbi:GSCOCT00014019001.2-RA-CDS [Cotesia congregata]|uniref:PGRP.5_Cc n=1 Tax=Cotesia congregata TaxID=51543 RepID=A0A8J2MH02_COTCN|nr:GSCOCT00014019001.2-RA-CDS [Cotesia congregata]CAG5082212.1 PGRP.5_Cc [Cotesia congregata]
MHIEGNGWADIGYNFLIGGDGLVYVGRGWDIEGAHAFGFNRKSIGISFIGTFNKETPPRRQIHALEKLIELGVKNEKISGNYKLLGHRQVSETLSPGDVLFGIIKVMDHWSEKP